MPGTCSARGAGRPASGTAANWSPVAVAGARIPAPAHDPRRHRTPWPAGPPAGPCPPPPVAVPSAVRQAGVLLQRPRCEDSSSDHARRSAWQSLQPIASAGHAGGVAEAVEVPDLLTAHVRDFFGTLTAGGAGAGSPR